MEASAVDAAVSAAIGVLSAVVLFFLGREMVRSRRWAYVGWIIAVYTATGLGAYTITGDRSVVSVAMSISHFGMIAVYGYVTLNKPKP